ncbi:MAG TPA: alanine--tRNA ligase [Terriglobia bacterium]|nr:alanine--tRNA ligase [Terriglobia bacterium]
MKADDIRSKFLAFFEEKGHRVVKSSSLVPANDPTLLFTNAGMNQFKDVFLGREKRDYLRATTAQKCVRAGGKHNDLEQVGRTTRHHTFFEMLGNFSFGDYFKKEAIPWAWELVTKDFAIPKDKLYVTIFEGAAIPHADIPRDTEAYECWRDVGVPADRVFELGMKDNFWQMGDTGPCGPCSEIHYDMGPAASDLGHTDCKFPCDCGRYVELWNLVFMQYDRSEDVKDGVTSYKFSLLPKPCVDTGAGLERLAAVLQSKLSNFDTDLFRPLIQEAAALANVEYGTNHDADVSLRIIADHARASTFLISDGVLPSNDGRGYVLRKIVRRAVRHGYLLGLNEPFLYKVSRHVVDIMGDAYPELAEGAQRVARAIKGEEARFAKTLSTGSEEFRREMRHFLKVYSKELRHMATQAGDLQFISELETLNDVESVARRATELFRRNAVVPTFNGKAAFYLYDTYGWPLDFIEDACRDFGFHMDINAFDRAMAEQRERARASWKGAEKRAASPLYLLLGDFPQEQNTVFEGYTQTESRDSRFVTLVVNGQIVNEVKPGQEAEIVLDHTPFYGEAGGQVGDTGYLLDPESGEHLAQVLDTYRPVAGLIAHKAVARETLRVGDVVTAVVDAERRDSIRRNHTATHLLHAALRNTLGTHVKQAGSLVAPDRLRFDFTHYAPLGDQDLLDIEDLVNAHVLRNEEVRTEIMDVDSAVNSGAMALFGEKYGDRVRVVSIADGFFSKELCGGTHVRRTGDIGLFKVVSEASVAAGTRRIEALTGTGVLEHVRRASETLALLSDTLRAKPDELAQAAKKLEESEKKLRKELETAQMKRAAASVGDLVADAREVKGVRVVAARVDLTDRNAMRQMVDNLRARLESGVIVLGSATPGGSDGGPGSPGSDAGHVSLVAAVTKDLTGWLDAGKIVKAAAAIVEGSGGGRKDLAEAGGKNPAKLDESLAAVAGIVEGML